MLMIYFDVHIAACHAIRDVLTDSSVMTFHLKCEYKNNLCNCNVSWVYILLC